VSRRSRILFAVGALAALGGMTACSIDPTELTRTIHIRNQLSATIVLQACTSQDCSHHSRGGTVAPGQTIDEIVQDTSLNPFRVAFLTSAHSPLGCFTVGPHIHEGEQVRLTQPTLTHC
jgi:hypothetical protein